MFVSNTSIESTEVCELCYENDWLYGLHIYRIAIALLFFYVHYLKTYIFWLFLVF